MENGTKEHLKIPIIGFIVDWLEDPYQQTVFEGVIRATEDFGAHLICFDGGGFLSDHWDTSDSNILYGLLGPENVDGLLVLTGALTRFAGLERFLGVLREYHKLPMLSLSQEVPGFALLSGDNLGGFRELIRHLALHHGFRRFALVGGPKQNQDARERLAALQATLEELNVPFDPATHCVEGDYMQDSGRRAALKLLQELDPRPDVIVAANDDMAIGVLDALQHAGLKVPADIAVAGFDDVSVSRFASPPLTTVAQNLFEQGYKGTELLLEGIRTGVMPSRTILPTRLVLRESCGCFSESVLAVEVPSVAGNGAPAAGTAAIRPASCTKEILARVDGDFDGAKPCLSQSLRRKNVRGLVDAYLAELKGEEGACFLGEWKRFIGRVLPFEVLGSACQTILSELRRISLPVFEEDRNIYRKGESLLHQARIVLSEKLVFFEKLRSIQREEEQRVLNYLREDLMIVFDDESLMRAISRTLPKLGVECCYISSFLGTRAEVTAKTAEKTTGTLQASLIMSLDRRGKTVDRRPFPAARLFPAGVRSVRTRTAWIVEALTQYDSTGIALLRLGTHNFKIYGEIRRIITGTLQGSHLFRQTREQNDNLRFQSEELTGSLERMRKLMGGVVNTLSLTVETRDPYTAGHERRVSDLARRIATVMGLSSDRIEAIRLASSVHDLGKLNVPSEILNKPGHLREAEMNLIRLHPQIAYDILSTIDFAWPIADIVVKHHERLDGSGYPRGLKAKDIPMESRIISVADVVEAMASHRPYRAALGIDVALEEIERQKGILFDTQVVDICVDLFRNQAYTFRFDKH